MEIFYRYGRRNHNQMQTTKFTFSTNVAVNVRGGDEAIHFYTQVLGLPAVNLTPDENNSVETKAGPLTLWIDKCTPEQEAHVGNVFFEFKVDNLSEALKLLDSKGCKLGTETNEKAFIGRMIVDPFGMRFHVFESKV